jgi:hypothetical protein
MNLRGVFFVTVTIWLVAMVSCDRKDGIVIQDDINNCKLVERKVYETNMGSCIIYDINETYVDSLSGDTIYRSYTQSKAVME